MDAAGQGSGLSEIMVWRGEEVMSERQGLRRPGRAGKDGSVGWVGSRELCLGLVAVWEAQQGALGKLPQSAAEAQR